jgi:GNAT superfamily N-acetyltransferase
VSRSTGVRVRVRPARAADFEVLRQLQHEADRDHAQHQPEVHRTPDPPRYTDEELAEVAACDNCALLVAARGGAVVGFVEASVRLPTEPYEPERPWCGVNNLAVRADQRRRGVGRTQMLAVEAWAKQKGISQVRLDVFEFSAAARALYAGLGYRPVWTHLVKTVTGPGTGVARRRPTSEPVGHPAYQNRWGIRPTPVSRQRL